MTAAEWEESDEPRVLLPEVEWNSSRKLRLFACACCRRAWSAIRDDRGRAAVETAEQFADDLISPAALIQTAELVDGAYGEVHASPAHGLDAVAMYAATLVTAERLEAWHVEDVLQATNEAVPYGQFGRSAQADLLREIFGNPFNRKRLDKRLRTSDVLLLANGIYDERAFDRMPVLADALQDAGCDSDDILAHLRDPQVTHVRGCWTLDLVLGKD